MTVDLILHGVPNGQDLWGVNDDTHYFSTFYVQKDEKEILTIDTRKLSGKSYCYYNYLKYKGVTACDGRAGAYLGITLRFDAYYKDVFNVFHLCEIVYNNLLDTILIKNDDNIKFKIPKFEDADRVLTEIKNKLINLIKLSATAKDFTPINDSFFNNEGKSIKAFLLDCTQENVMQALLKFGKVEVSKFYPSVNESKRIKAIEDKYKKIIVQKDTDLQNIDKQNETLRNEQDKLRNELKDNKDEINRLKTLVSEKVRIINENQEAVKNAGTYKKENEELKTSLQEKKLRIKNLESQNKKNEETLKIFNALKNSKEELESKLQKKNREIENLQSELNKSKDSSKFADLLKDVKEPLKTMAEIAGRQFETFPKMDSSNNEQSFPVDNGEYNKIPKENNSLFSKSIWQIVKIVLLALIFCLSLCCTCILCFSQNNPPTTNQIELHDNSLEKTFIKDTTDIVEKESTDDDKTDCNNEVVGNDKNSKGDIDNDACK